MKIINLEPNEIKLCLSKREFYIVSSAVIELSEAYHKPRLPRDDFGGKFGYPLEQNDRLYDEFMLLRKIDNREICVGFNRERYKIFCTALNEIIANFEDYEFQTITGVNRVEVMEILKELQDIKF